MDKIDFLLKEMTLEEKAGQLNLLVAGVVTGPSANPADLDSLEEEIKLGNVGGFFNGYGAEFTRKLQEIAISQSRLGIPLLFGADVIHGFKTIFPIPLAQAASWDMEAIEKAASIAAEEATAAGLNWNFVPMVDLSRDPRWGRVAEGIGEDPYLGSCIGEALVRGFQGAELNSPQTMAACTKHLVGYGAPEGGRDYNTVDISERLLRDVYLPPYLATIKAGVATVMTGFNELNGVPCTGNKFILDELLRKEWGFDGMVVSDYNSVGELIDHGFSEDEQMAAKMALEAGTDMDMEAKLFLEHLPALVEKGLVKEETLDTAVRRVLELKQKLGLLDDPFRYSDAEREKATLKKKAHYEAALDMSRKSMVLLKNEDQLLPLSKNLKTLAVIGPLAMERKELNGCWSFFADLNDPQTIAEGIKKKLGEGTQVLSAKGCEFYNNSKDLFKEAIQIGEQAEVIIMALGESAVMNGEAASRSKIGLPDVQLDLLKAIHQLDKPTILLLSAGRPLCLNWEQENIPSILLNWFLGTASADAIADVLFGDYNPSGKLPMTFPINEGQIPIYYNHKATGRAYKGKYEEAPSERIYASKYRDVVNDPLYPFGFGLSYTQFGYSEISQSKKELKQGETIKFSIELKNTGNQAGEEIVQLYIRDLFASITRPVLELKKFEKVYLEAGEKRNVEFELQVDDLSFFRQDMSFGAEPGAFKVFIGPNSKALKSADFTLLDY